MNIRRTLLMWALLSLLGGMAGAADAPPVLTGTAALKWGPPPPVFPAGAKFAVVNGDPAKTGNVTVRFKMPAGYTIPPHFHPTDEHVTVLGGDLSIGMGDVIDKAHALHLSGGGYAVAMAGMHHYAYTTKGATVQVHMQGPFGITYVNPADDPSRKTH
jgi:quercetin dioxygenase-like cupin family protein